jgi:hypothetical protein
LARKIDGNIVTRNRVNSYMTFSHESWHLLGYYTMLTGKQLPTFWSSIVLPSSGLGSPKYWSWTAWPETHNYLVTILEHSRSLQHRHINLKSCMFNHNSH